MTLNRALEELSEIVPNRDDLISWLNRWVVTVTQCVGYRPGLGALDEKAYAEDKVLKALSSRLVELAASLETRPLPFLELETTATAMVFRKEPLTGPVIKGHYAYDAES